MDTPYERMFGRQPNLIHLRTVGARAYANDEGHKDKISEHTWEGQLIGYSTESPIHHIYQAETRRIVSSRDISFIETAPERIVEDLNFDKLETS